ncbi:MAG: hypothetical protein CHACPFDD_03993 [Phycisphaerae bacterium]|nr:hypothetical protein [Phycisphaerae bacterium]
MIEERTESRTTSSDETPAPHGTRFVDARPAESPDRDAASAPPHAVAPPTAAPPHDEPPYHARPRDPRVLLERIDAALADIRAHLDALARDRERRDLTAGRLTGAIAQSLVIALLAWAASDWIFGVAFETLATKLGFALLLQLLALTGFLLSRD